jgi:hypothetical protein
VFVGPCEKGVGILNLSYEDDGKGLVSFDCEGDIIEGDFTVSLTEGNPGYFNVDIIGEFLEIRQTFAALVDGRLAIANGDCLAEGCARPPVSAVELDNPDYEEYFYPIDDLSLPNALHGTTDKLWNSACRCRDDICGENSLYEKMSVAFFNDGSFSYERYLYVDDQCSVESDIQDDESDAIGFYYLRPEYSIMKDNGEYVLASYLYLDSNLPLSANSDNCFEYINDEQETMYNCEAGLLIMVDGQIMLEEGDNNDQAYYEDQYNFENGDEFVEEFQQHEGAGGIIFSRLFEGQRELFPFELAAQKKC